MDRLLRRHGLERRLFGWLFALALIPTLAVLAVSLAAGAGLFGLIGPLGPWERLADSGRAVFEAADSMSAESSGGSSQGSRELSDALERHRADLSESLVQAQRWNFIGDRLSAFLPVAVLALALLLGLVALWTARRLARGLARPVGELVDWAGRLARGEPLPGPTPAEAREVEEVRVLRGALRDAAADLVESRRRELESERVQAWGEMARRVAHDMKNPLTPLRLAAHRLGSAARRDPSLAEVAAVIHEETARLDDLAREFAAIGAPPAGPFSQVDLAELLDGLLDADVPPAIGRTLRVEPGTVEVLGHYDTLVRAFRNLIRNAVEAVEQAGGGAIEIDIRAADGSIDIVVADSGIGIPEDAADRIFEPDYTRKSGGTGLGLAVVRQVVAAHGGAVHARPRPGGGAEFRVRLPAGENGTGGDSR